MDTALHDDDRYGFYIAEDETAFVAGHGGYRESFDIRIIKGRFYLDAFGVIPQAGTQDQRYFGLEVYFGFYAFIAFL